MADREMRRAHVRKTEKNYPIGDAPTSDAPTGEVMDETTDNATKDQVETEDPSVMAAVAAQEEAERQEKIRQLTWDLGIAKDSIDELNAALYEWRRRRDELSQELSDLTHKTRFQFDGYTYERSWETDWKWNKDDVFSALTRKVRELQVDPETGEINPMDPVELTIKVIRDCASISQFKTASGLVEYGIDPNDYGRKTSKPKYEIKKVHG